MRSTKLILAFLSFSLYSFSQKVITPEMLWSLGRITAKGISKDGNNFVYQVTTFNKDVNKSSKLLWSVPVKGGMKTEVKNLDSVVTNQKVSPDGKWIIYTKEVLIKKVKGSDIYPDLPLANAYVFDELNYRHWDEWEDGKFSHVFLASLVNGQKVNEKDLMEGEPYDCPQKPFGGDEDFVWSKDGKSVVYVTKKKYGTAYAISTNTDLYSYDIASGKTTNLTESNPGYDINPAFSSKGQLAWLSQKRDGYESDKQDIIVMQGNKKVNLTADYGGIHVAGFRWSNDGNLIYAWVPLNATEQVFVIDPKTKSAKPLTNGEHQITSVDGETADELIVTLSDFNHAPEAYAISKSSGAKRQLTHINDDIYSGIRPVQTLKKDIVTTDGLRMPTWIIMPPDFDPTKKYPTLLFLLGGPQSTTPFYSFRWNLQLIASQGYIVVAPDRRGVFGNGYKWTEGVTKDWGGQVMQDYLSAIDDISKEPYVDKSRRGAVGASFGGYSAFMLESMHDGRFKTFIAHDGIFDYRSMYGSTEEVFFENWEKGGPYWDKKNAVAQKSFSMSPSNFVEKWNTPILIIHGGKDYRVPAEQGMQAFQAAQLRGIKSRFLYLPDENHWVLSNQNALVWQREFFRWLKETL